MALAPWNPALWNGLMISHQILGQYQSEHGLDSRKALDEATMVCKKGIALRNDFASLHINI